MGKSRFLPVLRRQQRGGRKRERVRRESSLHLELHIARPRQSRERFHAGRVGDGLGGDRARLAVTIFALFPFAFFTSRAHKARGMS